MTEEHKAKIKAGREASRIAKQNTGVTTPPASTATAPAINPFQHPAFKTPEATVTEKPKIKIVLKDVLGNEVSNKDYFYSSKGEDAAPAYFNKICGDPVNRDDMLKVFNKVFAPADGFLFYKERDKECFLVIVPLKYSVEVGVEQNSIDGEFQKHAISFLMEGSVNLETLRMKLLRIKNWIKMRE